jgi:hypothetical protein
MLNKDQSQDVGDRATAIQAGGSVTVNNMGVSYSEAKSIAQDVFRANFYQMVGIAKDIAYKRMEEITDLILQKLQDQNPIGLVRAGDPDFQYALFEVQKEYARNGDKDLGDLLVDLLVDRSRCEQRDILQIVLNESLVTAPKLTDSHLVALAILFLFKYSQNNSIVNHEKLGEYLDKHLLPFVSKVTTKPTCYQHLEFCGCGSVQLAGRSLEDILGIRYPGLFSKGFDEAEISKLELSIGTDPRFFIPCLNDSKRLQVRALNEDQLNLSLDQNEISLDEKAKIRQLFIVSKMNENEISEKVTSVRPFMAEIFQKWRNSSLQNFTLTSVGIAIGHANIKRLIGNFTNLEVWIN